MVTELATGLATLPTELILAIAEPMSQATLHALALANKHLHAIINPVLYARSVKNQAPDITVLAARDGNLDTLRMAASFGADMNRVYWVPVPTWLEPKDFHLKTPETGYGVCWATPLHMAAAYGHYDVVKWLLNEGVDVNVPGKLLCRCLSFFKMRVYQCNSTDAWTSRLRWVFASDVAGTSTPLHLAICRGNQSIARFLVSRGASLDIRYNQRAKIPRTHGVATLCDLETRESHLGLNDTKNSPYYDFEDLELERHNYMHAIHTAAASGQKEILRYLIATGVDINTLDGSNANALHYALNDSDAEMCKLVLDLGVRNSTQLDCSDWTPNENHISVVEWAVNHCRGKTEVISRTLSHIAERGDSFWKVDEVSGKYMVLNSVSGYGHNTNLFKPSYNKWISQFLQGAILTCSLGDANKLQEDLVLFFVKNTTIFEAGTDILDMILEAFNSLRGIFYGDSQKLDMKQVVSPGTPLWEELYPWWAGDEEQEEDEAVAGKELGTRAIQLLQMRTCRSDTRDAIHQKSIAPMRSKIDWLLDHGATQPKQ